MTEAALNKNDIARVRKLIVHWKGKLTWGELITSMKNELKISITRQSLCKYEVIYQEYNRKKEILRGVIPVENEVTVADAGTIKKLQKQLETACEDRDLYKRDYELAQIIINRVIINAKSIPNLDIQALFAEIDEDRSLTK